MNKEGKRHGSGRHLLKTQAKYLRWLDFLNGDGNFPS